MTTPAPQYTTPTSQSFSSPPGSSPPKRPGGVLAAAILSMVVGVLFFIAGLIMLFDPSYAGGGPFNVQAVLSAVPQLLLGVAAIVLGFVALSGSDFGRVFTAGVGGAALYSGAGSLFNTLGIFLVDTENPLPPSSYAVSIPYVVNALLGLGILIALASPAISWWTLARKAAATPGGPGAPGQPTHPASGSPLPPGLQPPPGMQPPQSSGVPPMGGPAANPTVSPAAASPAPQAPEQPSPYASDDPKT